MEVAPSYLKVLFVHWNTHLFLCLHLIYEHPTETLLCRLKFCPESTYTLSISPLLSQLVFQWNHFTKWELDSRGRKTGAQTVQQLHHNTNGPTAQSVYSYKCISVVVRYLNVSHSDDANDIWTYNLSNKFFSLVCAFFLKMLVAFFNRTYT